MPDHTNFSATGSTFLPAQPAGVRRLWIVRHGVTDWNMQQRILGSSDVALAAQGEVQAQLVGTLLATCRIAAIYASDLQRASRTAEIIVEQLAAPLPVQLSSAWREHAFGAWEGLTYAEIAERYPLDVAFFTDPVGHVPTNGESYHSLVQRVLTAFQELTYAARDIPEGDIVLVSHGGALRALLCALLLMPPGHQWQLRIDHGSLSALDFLPDDEDVAVTVSLALLNYRPSATLFNTSGALHV
jgi:Fructose-2,6-bisphosphatase